MCSKKPTLVPGTTEAALQKAVEAWVSGDNRYFEVLDKNAELAKTRRQLFKVLGSKKRCV